MDEGIWPVTVAGWVALVVSLAVFVGGILAYYKWWVIFRHSIDERFKQVNNTLAQNTKDFTKAVERIVDDVIGLPRNVTVKGEMNGIGRRIDDIAKDEIERDQLRREKLAEFFQAQGKIRELDYDIKNLAERLGEVRENSTVCLAEVRALTRDTSTRLEDINRVLTVLATEFKHIQRRVEKVGS